MDTLDDILRAIKTQLTIVDAAVRSKYLSNFSQEVSEFSTSISQAFIEWRNLDNRLGGSEKKGYVSALVYCAIALHISSMKLLLSGNTIPAGNLHRQVVETIALACLCSAKDLDVLHRFIEDRYSTNNAIRDALRQADRLRLNADSINALKRVQEFYHQLSHPSQLMIAYHMSFSDRNILLGPSFDNGKIEEYRKEISVKVSLAKTFGTFVKGIAANISSW